MQEINQTNEMASAGQNRVEKKRRSQKQIDRAKQAGLYARRHRLNIVEVEEHVQLYKKYGPLPQQVAKAEATFGKENK
jgi:hypothetical protein